MNGNKLKKDKKKAIMNFVHAMISSSLSVRGSMKSNEIEVLTMSTMRVMFGTVKRKIRGSMIMRIKNFSPGPTTV